MDGTGPDVNGVNWTAWAEAGHPLPGETAHAPMMPYARSSAAEARRTGRAGKDYREAAVLIGVEANGTVALIERSPEQGPHGGQMAVPGGAREPGESLLSCAVREWREELGLPEACAPLQEPVALTEIHVVPSRFVVRPFVAPVVLPASLTPDPVEVAAVHWVRLSDLAMTEYRQEQPVRVQLPGQEAIRWKAPGFAMPGVPFIWGATALMLAELAAWHERWSSTSSAQ